MPSLSFTLSPAAEEDAKMRHLCEDDDLRVSRILQNYPWYLFFLSFLFFSLFFSTFICTENANCLP